ncbi:Cytochrome P450 71D10 [Triticum urartu]|uniref:Cytochrome P450 71D10 n=1 Tax=Triticum urartu TaxID=4572 RepID=M7YJ61_TRIUA|nr:Cytochrome P450 71D10 [Triticum urartu]
MPCRIRRERREMMEFVDAIVREHQENRVAAGDDEDLLDVLLRVQSEGELDPPLTDDDIKTVIIVSSSVLTFSLPDMFMAGSETSATLLQWAMAELVKNPGAMRKAQEEVRREVAGRVTEDALGGLRYLGLVIKETLRLHPPATLILRECRAACRVLGFEVPAGAMVLVNAWAIGRDAASWGADAEEFRPERFDGSGVDFKGTDLEYIPFGAGRRMCPGVAFGLANVELALASLLYHFEWEVPEPGEELDMAEAMGLTTRRRSDLLLVPKLRVPLPC